MSLNNTKTNQRGFTIVELLIVIVVIAILAAITIVAYNGIQNRAKTAQHQSNASGIAKVAEAVNASQDSTGYPETVAGYTTTPKDVKLPSGVTVSVGTAAPTPAAAKSAGEGEPKSYTVVPCGAAAARTGVRVYYYDAAETDTTKQVKHVVAGSC